MHGIKAEIKQTDWNVTFNLSFETIFISSLVLRHINYLNFIFGKRFVKGESTGGVWNLHQTIKLTHPSLTLQTPAFGEDERVGECVCLALWSRVGLIAG